MRRRAIAIVAALLALEGVAAARHDELADSDRTIAGINVALSDLNDVRRKLGAAPDVGSPPRLCYASADAPSDLTKLAFFGTGTTMGFELVMGGLPMAASTACVPSAVVKHDLATGSGLHVGSLRDDFDARFPGGTEDGPRVTWKQCSKRFRSAAEIVRFPGRGTGSVNDCATVVGEFGGPVLLRLHVEEAIGP